MGKALEQPIHQLLGGAFRTRVQAYATGLSAGNGPTRPPRWWKKRAATSTQALRR